MLNLYVCCLFICKFFVCLLIFCLLVVYFSNHYLLIVGYQQCIKGNVCKCFTSASTFFQSFCDIVILVNDKASY